MSTEVNHHMGLSIFKKNKSSAEEGRSLEEAAKEFRTGVALLKKRATALSPDYTEKDVEQAYRDLHQWLKNIPQFE